MSPNFVDEVVVNTRDRTYSVVFGRIRRIACDGSALLVSSRNVAVLYLDFVLSLIDATGGVTTCILDDGEIHKNMDSVLAILDHAFEAKLNRKSVMISLGGGVISDMVGFASGIYQRGIDFISIPTTLLAMVDASVGGKCGVNSPFGKNLIGIFHHPRAVFVDTMFLDSLPDRELRSGLSEMIKIFACFDFDALSDFRESRMREYIIRSVAIKARVVGADERETTGLRALLNYGHTFGHAIELETNYGEYLHGEAVSIGMIMANTMSRRLGLLSQDRADMLLRLLDSLNLPTSYKIRDRDSFLDSFYLDKKSLGGLLHFVLLHDDRACLHSDVSNDTLIEVLDCFV